VIRFSAFLVVVAVGLLVAGVVTSKLLLVYLAIGVSGVALLALGVGAAVKWRELFGKAETVAAEARVQEPVAVPAPQALASPALASPAQHEHQGYPRPAPAPLPSGPARQPAAVGSAALWESAVPPTGMFPMVRPEPQPPTPPAPARTPAAARAAESVRAAQSASAGVSADASAPGLAQDQAVAPPRTVGQLQPGATDQQAPEAEPSGQDLQPAADSRPLTDLQTTKSAAAAPQAAEDTAKAKAAPDTAPPAAAPISASAIPPPAAVPIRPTPEPAVATPEPAAASPQPTVARAPFDAGPNPQTAGPNPQPAGPNPEAPENPQAPEDPQTAVNPQMIVTVVPGVPRYHNASCILIRFMGENDLETMTLAAARNAGCTPCRACLPDQPERQPDLPPPRAPVR
jgi:hypothetical protein